MSKNTLNVPAKEVKTSSLIKDFYKLLSNKRRKQLLILLFLMLINGFSEILSLGSLVPFLGVLSDPKIINDFEFFGLSFEILSFENHNQTIIFFGSLFIIVAFISVLLRIFNVYFSNSLSAQIGSDISCKAFENTLYQDYEYHTNANTSEIISTITVNIQHTISGIYCVMQFISSIIIITSVVLSLIIIDWKIAISSMIIIGLLYTFIIYKSRNRLNNNSKVIAQNVKQQFKLLQEGLGSIREIILSQNQLRYLQEYKINDRNLRNRYADNVFVVTYPRYLLEFIALFLFAIFSITISILDQNTFQRVIPLIAVFALGSQRLLISYQLAYSTWSNLKSKSHTISTVISTVNQVKSISKSRKRIENSRNYLFKKAIELRNVSFKYKSKKSLILNNLNLFIKKGERIGIIGKTGSGKSTLIEIIVGLLKPVKGKILIDDKDISLSKNNEIFFRWQSSISYVPQDIFLLDTSIAENIAIGSKLDEIDVERLNEALKISCSDEFVNKLSMGYRTIIGERGIQLSGGQRQRLAIARAIYKKNRIIILDEATSSLDTKTEKKVLDSIMNFDKNNTIIMITHRPFSLKFCNQIFEFKDGKLFENIPLIG